MHGCTPARLPLSLYAFYSFVLRGLCLCICLSLPALPALPAYLQQLCCHASCADSHVGLRMHRDFTSTIRLSDLCNVMKSYCYISWEGGYLFFFLMPLHPNEAC